MIVLLITILRAECTDTEIKEKSCKEWKGKGYCEKNSKYRASMEAYCKKSCGFCSSGNEP